MTNRFKDKTLRHEYEVAMLMYNTKHQSLFLDSGERRRSPNFGSTVAAMFWQGFDGLVMGAGWDTESKKTLAYAYWRAGQDAAKSVK